MIDELRAMAIFAAVAETGSFTAAGRKLRLTTSVVSHHVSKLENRLAINLLYRSTRSLSLTDEGRKLLISAQQMVEAAESGLNQIAEQSEEPSGNLTITMPAFVMNSHYETAIWNFARIYSGINIILRSNDRQVDLIDEGYDMAIRLGEMTNSSLRTRRLGGFARKLVCAPSYLSMHGPIETLDDLRKCIAVEMEMLPNSVILDKNGRHTEIQFQPGRVRVNSVTAAHSAVVSGLGIQRLPATEVEQDLRDGKLVELLPEWSLPDLGVYAVWPETGRGNLTRRMVDHLTAT